MMTAAIFALTFWGINFGIDFKGGSLLEVEYQDVRPDINVVKNALSPLALGSPSVQPVGEKGLIIRFRETSEEVHQSVLSKLRESVQTEAVENQSAGDGEGEENSQPAESVIENRFDSVGPSIGEELKSRSLSAIILVLAAMILYIAWSFRKVSKPIASWKYGLVAIIALFHDVLITVAVFSVMGKFWQIEINTPFVAAILTVIGYSVNDTIIVFDRLRENLPKSDLDFAATINKSVLQTLSRSINTSFTTILVLTAIIIFGGDSIREFVLALAVGILTGTYSSIFFASPLLAVWEKWQRRMHA